MAINTGLASLSEGLWTVATGTYMLAVVAYTGEYAFGKNGRIASTSPASAAVKEPALVGAGGAAPVEQRPYGAGVVDGVAVEQLEVPPVALEAEVDEVADERHQAHAEVDERVHDHAQDHHLGQAEARGLEHDPGRHQPGHGVADERHQADHRVEAEPDAGARDPDHIVEQIGGPAHAAFRGEGALGSAGALDIGDGVGGGRGRGRVARGAASARVGRLHASIIEEGRWSDACRGRPWALRLRAGPGSR